MLGAVHMRNVHLLIMVWVKTAYAACRWNLAISDRRLISETQQLILSRMKSSMKDFDPKGAPRYLCPWMVMLTPEPWKCSSAASKCSGLTTTHVLHGLGLYPKCGPYVYQAVPPYVQV